jgi:transcription initiation factor IIE alpha subunit
LVTLRIYKFKDKLVVYLPFEVTRQLGLKGDEEVDFFKFSESSFLFAKKEDITKLLLGSTKTEAMAVSVAKSPRKLDLSQDEIGVLKKLDTLRYANRTPSNVAKLLNEGEKKILNSLLSRKIVLEYKDRKDSPYSIAKDAYDTFLMRKKNPAPQQIEEVKPAVIEPLQMKVENENVKKLETDGFVVLPTDAEASSLSVAVEDSIRSGKVLGIRAFNKKFYIILRTFFDKNSSRVIKELKEGPKSVRDMVKDTGLNEDAVRSILYLLSEQGDVSERRKDIFTLI